MRLFRVVCVTGVRLDTAHTFNVLAEGCGEAANIALTHPKGLAQFEAKDVKSVELVDPHPLMAEGV